MLLASLWRRLASIPLKAVLRSSPTVNVDGFRLAEATPDHTNWETFVELTRDALKCIQASDPRRYAWLIGTIETIANGPMVGRVAAYLDVGRICLVDVQEFLDDDLTPKVRAALLACTLVHEATHGRMFQLGIPYNTHTRERAERRCYREQLRFLKRGLAWAIGEEVEEDLEALAPFSVSSCERAWNTTLLEHLRGTHARMMSS